MKEWSKAVIVELDVRSTEYGGSKPNKVDGTYTSKDGKVVWDTYSGDGNPPTAG